MKSKPRLERALLPLQVLFILDCYRVAGPRRRHLRARLAKAFRVSTRLITKIVKQRGYRDRRGPGKKRGRKRVKRYNALKTHCPHGHPYVEENIYRLPYRLKDGSLAFKRQCLTCKNSSKGRGIRAAKGAQHGTATIA